MMRLGGVIGISGFAIVMHFSHLLLFLLPRLPSLSRRD